MYAGGARLKVNTGSVGPPQGRNLPCPCPAKGVVAVVVADAVARHGGIPELIPKTEDMQEEKGREKNRWEINKKGAVIELKKTTKMTLCANPYTLYNSCTPRDSIGINHERQRAESSRYVKGIDKTKSKIVGWVERWMRRDSRGTKEKR